MDADAPTSPTSPKKGVADETLQLQVQQFLDEWHYRIIHSSLGKSWTRKRVCMAALDIFELNGVSFTAEEREYIVSLDEALMISMIVGKMPDNLRENFEHLAMQLQMVVTTVTRIRHGLEAEDPTEVMEVIEEGDKETVVKNIMKQAVVHASKEVKKIHSCQETWTSNMTNRIDRLMKAADYAERANQQLISVEAQISTFCSSQSEKSKKVLMGMADGKESTLIHSVFSSWSGYMTKVKAEYAIRHKYETMALEAEQRLMDYRKRQTTNVANLLMRAARDGDAGLIYLCFETWENAMESQRVEGMSSDELKAAEAKLAGYAAEQKAATKKILANMASQNDAGFLLMVLQAWIQYHADYQKNKELEDQVRAAELAVQEHLKKKKDEAKGVLDRMSGATDTGLVANMLKYWVQYLKEEKEDRKAADLLAGNASKFSSMASRQLGNAKGVQMRVNDIMKMNLLIRVMNVWVLETKVNRVEKHYTNKMEGKRRQLQSVQTLFKSFALQLEQGLGNVEGDSSGRGKGSRRSQSQTNLKGDGVSLPPIHSGQAA